MIDLTNGLAGDCKEIILALMETPTKYDTLQLIKAINVKIFFFLNLKSNSLSN